MLRSELLSILRNPRSGAPLSPVLDGLRDNSSGEEFPVRAGIPSFVAEGLAQPHRQAMEYFDAIADDYDALVATYLGRRGVDASRLHAELLDHLPRQGARRVLELGIGTGASLRHLPADTTLVGVDLSFRMLRRCAKRAGELSLPVDLVQADLGSALPFTDDVFDVAFQVTGWRLLADPSATMREVARTIRGGGYLLLADEASPPDDGEGPDGANPEIASRALHPHFRMLDAGTVGGGELWWASFEATDSRGT